MVGGGKQLLGTMEMILTRPPLWRSLLPPLFSWLNVILWIAFGNKKKKKKKGERVADIKRCAHFVIATRFFKPPHSNSKKKPCNHIVYVFMKKMVLQNTKTNPCATLSIGPFIVILKKTVGGDETGISRKRCLALEKEKKPWWPAHPHASRPWTLNPWEPVTCIYKRATTVLLVLQLRWI